MIEIMVYANRTLVDKITEREGYTVDDYKADCTANGWEFAPCNEDDDIEFVICENEEN